VTPAGQIGNATVEMPQKLRPNMHKTTFYKPSLESKIFQMELANHPQVSLELQVGFISSFHCTA
jgi:hypothetical protein